MIGWWLFDDWLTWFYCLVWVQVFLLNLPPVHEILFLKIWKSNFYFVFVFFTFLTVWRKPFLFITISVLFTTLCLFQNREVHLFYSVTEILAVNFFMPPCFGSDTTLSFFPPRLQGVGGRRRRSEPWTQHPLLLSTVKLSRNPLRPRAQVCSTRASLLFSGDLRKDDISVLRRHVQRHSTHVFVWCINLEQ